VTIFYTNTQARILANRLATSINIVDEVHKPYNQFDLQTGVSTEREGYEFQLAFTVYDVVNVQHPDDLDKIGKLRAYTQGWVYDVDSGTLKFPITELKYHRCSR
jgi:hypothetical protein